MKISEVRDVIQKHSQDQLRVIIAELYKAIPKAVKEENDIDHIIRDPTGSIQPRSGSKQRSKPDIDILTEETNSFIEDAYSQHYFAPNRFVSKRERPKWRFIVKRLYKDLLLAADEDNVPEAAQLLEKLYELLCHSCKYVLFNAYDPFQSVGIDQEDFFRRILALKYQCEEKNTFLRNALLSMANVSLNRYTLREDLMWVILEFAKTPDLREMTVALCTELIETIKRRPLSKKGERESDHETEEKRNSLTLMGFLCYAQLYEYENAISYFKTNYCKDDKEVALFVLLRLLFGLNQKNLFLREYEAASRNGTRPRDILKKIYSLTKENGVFPANCW